MCQWPRRGWAPLLILTLMLVPACARKAARSPAGETLPYVELDNAFQPFRRDFEGESGKVRLVAIVSPSCGDCNAAVQDLVDVVTQRINSPDLAVSVVWTSIMPSDVGSRTKQVAEKFAGPGICHYWDDSGRIARAFARLFDLPTGRNVYNLFLLYGRNDTWDPDARMNSEPPNQNALVAGWKPGKPQFLMGESEGVAAPEWNSGLLEEKIRALLAEPESR